MQIERQAKFHGALALPMRLRIVAFLLQKRDCTCICRLAEHVGRDQSVVFRHIQILKDAGIVSTRKEGNYLMCCIKDAKRLMAALED